MILGYHGVVLVLSDTNTNSNTTRKTAIPHSNLIRTMQGLSCYCRFCIRICIFILFPKNIPSLSCCKNENRERKKTHFGEGKFWFCSSQKSAVQSFIRGNHGKVVLPPSYTEGGKRKILLERKKKTYFKTTYN